MTMTRKEFLGTLIGGAALVAGCGKDDEGSDASSQRNCAANGTTANIDANHGHVITVTSADVTSGADKTYDITGTADHPHTVTVTAADFARLQSNANASVQKTTSTTLAHMHTVTILCA